MHDIWAEIDKNWLRQLIKDKETHLKNINGALVSEVISDAVVLGGGLSIAFNSITSFSLLPVVFNSLTMVQLGLAYKTIDSLYAQRIKVGNDIHVLNAILNLDETAPDNITSM